MRPRWTLVVLLTMSSVYAQPQELRWNRTFGGTGEEKCQATVETNDHGFALAGHSYSFGAGMEDFWLVKTNSRGIQQWARRYGRSNAERAWAIQQTSDGGYILAGMTQSYGAGAKDFWLLKTNSNGDSLWSRTFGGSLNEWATCVRQTSDGGYVLAGWTQSYGAGDFDMWVVKTNATGQLTWSHTYGGAYQDECHDIQELPGGGYIISGFTHSFGAGQEDFYLVRTDGIGTELWSHSYGGSSPERSWAATLMGDGGFAVVGMTMSYGSGAKDFWLVRTDSNGEQLWHRAFGGISNEWATSVRESEDGGIILGGWTQTYGAGNLDMWLVKTLPNGDLEWDRTYGGSGFDECHAFLETGNGIFVLAGFTNSSGAGNYDFALLKTRHFQVTPTRSDMDQIVESSKCVTVSTKSVSTGIPNSRAFEAYPNPFNPSTSISFTIPQATNVLLRVFDVNGRQVAQVTNRTFEAGNHQIKFSASNLPSGVYFMQLNADNVTKIKKLLLIK